MNYVTHSTTPFKLAFIHLLVISCPVTYSPPSCRNWTWDKLVYRLHGFTNILLWSDSIYFAMRIELLPDSMRPGYDDVEYLLTYTI